MRLLGPIFLLFLGLLASAPAQEAAPERPPVAGQPPTIEREIKGRAGRDIRILVLTNVRPDCTSGPLPTVRLVTPPTNGKITVRRVRLRATNVKQCLSLDVPALVGLYRSAADFEGNDTALVEIRPDGGSPQLRNLTIRITKGEAERTI